MKLTDPSERDEMRSAAELPRDTSADAFLADCLHGLAQPRKVIPCKWLYDATGSALFEAICDTPEYYPSRTEAALLAEAAPWLGGILPPGTELVEFGSGASRKTRLLLDTAPAIARYVPIDISDAELARASRAIATDYPHLAVRPLLGDFTDPGDLDLGPSDGARLGFFPGSTLGNFAPDAAVAFLAQARALLGEGSRLLLGIDVAKDVPTLLAAYDDAAGVTAAFNLNLIARMNRELDCDADASAFQHRALWNADASRIEMHLVSLRPQRIAIGDVTILLVEGETIHTENSHKLSRATIDGMVRAAGWSVERRWNSEKPSYDLILLQC